MELEKTFHKLYPRFIVLPKPISSYFYKIDLYNDEKVISNILRFFLNPNEIHNLGDTFIRALIDCYAEVNEQYGYDSYISTDSFYCKPEDTTSNRNRIDVLVRTSNSLIVIENKIEAKLNNPLDDYIDHSLSSSKEKENKFFIILSIYPINRQKIELYNQNKENKFYNILYDDFLLNVKTRLLNRIESVNNKYLVFLMDFIETINHFYHKGGQMENFKFYLDNINELENLSNSYNQFKNQDFGYQINEELKSISEKLNDSAKFKQLGEWFFDEKRSGKNHWVTFPVDKYYNHNLEFRCLEITFEDLFSKGTFSIQISTADRYNRKKYVNKLNEFLIGYIRKENLESGFKNSGITLSDPTNHVLLIKEYRFEELDISKLKESIFKLVERDWGQNIDDIQKILDEAKKLAPEFSK